MPTTEDRDRAEAYNPDHYLSGAKRPSKTTLVVAVSVIILLAICGSILIFISSIPK